MEEFNLDEFKKSLSQIADNVEIKPISDYFEANFREGIFTFKINIKEKSLEIINFNIYDRYKFKNSDFTSLGQEIIEKIIKYLKKIKYNKIIAINIRPTAINF